MKTVCKKLLSLMLVAILLVSAVPFQASADQVDAPIIVPVAVYINNEPVNTSKTLEVGTEGVILDEALAMSKIRDQEGRTFDKWTNNSGVTVTGNNLTYEWLQSKLQEDPTYSLNIYLIAETTQEPEESQPEESQPEKKDSYTLTFDANGGTIGSTGGATLTKTVKAGAQIGDELPAVTRSGYTLVGWYDEDGKQVEAGAYYNWDKDITVTAKWALKTNRLIVKRVLNGNLNGAKTIYDQEVDQRANLLDYLDAQVAGVVSSKLPAGYSWDGYWRDYALNKLNQQDDDLSEPQTVYVNFAPKTYTIYFNTNGGTVAKTSMTVTYGKAVGTLPTPTREGDVFLGWFDEDGVQYTKDTVYSVAGDTTLVARWEKEALVLLKIYINGDTSSADRIVDMTGYIADQNVTRSEVEKVVKKYYTAKTSAGLDLDGLFLDETWAEYKKNNNYAGTPTIQVEEDELPMYVYVMVNNAKYGATSSSSSNTEKEADPTNPKTGDMIVVPMIFMLVSASALAAAYLTNKKRMVK